jgi:hypothetical protein
VLVEDARFESDPEGVGYAREINAHLPPAVRVLSVQVRARTRACVWA